MPLINLAPLLAAPDAQPTAAAEGGAHAAEGRKCSDASTREASDGGTMECTTASHEAMKGDANAMRAGTEHIGCQLDGAGGHMELRNCKACGSTLGVPRRRALASGHTKTIGGHRFRFMRSAEGWRVVPEGAPRCYESALYPSLAEAERAAEGDVRQMAAVAS